MEGEVGGGGGCCCLRWVLINWEGMDLVGIGVWERFVGFGSSCMMCITRAEIPFCVLRSFENYLKHDEA